MKSNEAVIFLCEKYRFITFYVLAIQMENGVLSII
jgi:hypothetical protein